MCFCTHLRDKSSSFFFSVSSLMEAVVGLRSVSCSVMSRSFSSAICFISDSTWSWGVDNVVAELIEFSKVCDKKKTHTLVLFSASRKMSRKRTFIYTYIQNFNLQMSWHQYLQTASQIFPLFAQPVNIWTCFCKCNNDFTPHFSSKIVLKISQCKSGLF